MFIPVSRSKALSGALVWCVPAAVLVLAALYITGRFTPQPVRVVGRLVDYSLALVGLGLALSAAYCGLRGFAWIALSVWPRRVGVCAESDALTLRLGPFGTHRYEAAQLEVRYPFELDEEESESPYEALLPQEQQLATLLPQIVDRNTKRRVDPAILRFVGLSEPGTAAVLRPLLECWRAIESEPAVGTKG